MASRQFIDRQMRLGIIKREADDDILTADLAPQPLRRPFLRHRAAQTFDPDKIPFGHGCTLSGPLPPRPALFTPGHVRHFAAEISHFKASHPGGLNLFRPGRDNPDHCLEDRPS